MSHIPAAQGHGLLIGLVGNGGINAPLYVYVTHWFDRRRGTALALISSGQYVAGALWPAIFERAIDRYGWQHTMVFFAVAAVAVIVPAAALFLRPPPQAPAAGIGAAGRLPGARAGIAARRRAGLAVAGVVLLLRADGHAARASRGVLQRSRHRAGAWRGDAVAAARHRLRQPAMLGLDVRPHRGLAHGAGGLGRQVAAMAGFLAARNDADLFMVATAFGLGFSGVIPAYVLVVRQLFPAAEAARRIPVLLLCSGSGMAAGGSLGGVMYAGFGFSAPAFATCIAFNLANLPPPGRRTRRPPAAGWRPTRRPALGVEADWRDQVRRVAVSENALALLARPRRQQVGDTGAARPIFPGAHRRGRVRLERRPANPRRDLAL